jgi:hypothetical protein
MKMIIAQIYQSESSQRRSKRRRSQAGMLRQYSTKGRLAKDKIPAGSLTHCKKTVKLIREEKVPDAPGWHILYSLLGRQA